jgi:lipopolysaccharide/colanic/teichoic acid biosynthesis glycosyltransferase
VTVSAKNLTMTATSDRAAAGHFWWPVGLAVQIVVAFAAMPLLLVVALLVAADVGAPLTSWSRETGRQASSRHFRFRTFRRTSTAIGSRRLKIGVLIHHYRLDLLPDFCIRPLKTLNVI